MTNPYADLPDHCFWSRAVTWTHPAQIDPMTKAPFVVAPTDRVATMGSCFAQHISRHLQKAGFNYFVAETAPEGMAADQARAAGYGVFSARYGNVYTVRQAVQLFDRAFGRAAFKVAPWKRDDRFVDPFRPQIEPDGFASAKAVAEAETAHLAAVKRMFQEADILVFTLGLTEAWRDRKTGAILPLAPGVAGGAFDPKAHEAINFSVAETIADLEAFRERLHEVNPNLRIILTVSPVPLKATFEDRHVLQSTVYSKSVLRVSAQALADAHPAVCYFPSFEIITGPAGAGRYYAPDLREVLDLGVSHVMRVFERHFIDAGEAPAPLARIEDDSRRQGDVVCDEEVIEAALKGSHVERRMGGAAPRASAPVADEERPDISAQDIRDAYRLFLGRKPESDAVIERHRKGRKDRGAFVLTLLKSQEFARRVGAEEAAAMREWFEWSRGGPGR